MVRSKRDHKVEAFPPERAQQSLAAGIRLRTLGWGFQHPQPQVSYALVELQGENAVPVKQQETIAVVRWDGFTQLLECP